MNKEEQKLKKLFDYQRFEKNPRLARMIAEAEGSRELFDDELEGVFAAGSAGSAGAVELTGPYTGDRYGGGGTHTRAIGWSGLTLGRVFSDGCPSPCEIKKDNVTIGWAPFSSIKTK